MNIINNIKDLKKRIKVISENVFTSTANDDFKIKIINEDEFNQTLKKQYDLYIQLLMVHDKQYIEPIFPDPNIVKYSVPNKLLAPALNVDLRLGTVQLI